MPVPTSLPVVIVGGTTGGHPVDSVAVNTTINAITMIPATSKTASYTFVLADSGECVESNSASALIFTVPPNSSVAFPIGTVIALARIGTGALTIAAGAGVTVNSASTLTLRAQWSEASMRKRATNTWLLSGDLT